MHLCNNHIFLCPGTHLVRGQASSWLPGTCFSGPRAAGQEKGFNELWRGRGGSGVGASSQELFRRGAEVGGAARAGLGGGACAEGAGKGRESCKSGGQDGGRAGQSEAGDRGAESGDQET